LQRDDQVADVDAVAQQLERNACPCACRVRASLQVLFARAWVPADLARALGVDELLDALVRDA
jgi:hypothetical protein